MKLFRNITIYLLIMSSCLCYADNENKVAVNTLMGKIDQDKRGVKKEMAMVLIAHLNNEVLQGFSREHLNRLLSTLAKAYQTPGNLNTFLSSTLSSDVVDQRELLIFIYGTGETYRADVGSMIEESDMLSLLQMSRKEFNDKARDRHHKPEEIISDKEEGYEKVKILVHIAGKGWIDNMVSIKLHNLLKRLSPYEGHDAIYRFLTTDPESKVNELMKYYKLDPCEREQVKKIVYQECGISPDDINKPTTKQDVIKKYLDILSMRPHGLYRLFRQYAGGPTALIVKYGIEDTNENKYYLDLLMQSTTYGFLYDMSADNFKSLFEKYKDFAKAENKANYLVSVYNLEEGRTTRYVEYVIKNSILSFKMFKHEDSEKFIKSMEMAILLRLMSVKEKTGTDALVSDLLELQGLDEIYRGSLTKMVEQGFSVKELFLDLDRHVLESFKNDASPKKQQKPDPIIEEEIRMSSRPGYTNTPVTDDEFRSVEKMELYLKGVMIRLYSSKEEGLKQFKKLNLTTPRDFVNATIKEIALDIFDEGKLRPESVSVLSDASVFGKIMRTLNLKGGVTGFCSYLSKQINAVTPGTEHKHINPNWENGLESLKFTLSKAKPERAMMNLFKEQTEKDVSAISVVGKHPELFTDENIIAVMNEAKVCESRSKEKTLIEQVKLLIEAKHLNNYDVSVLNNELEMTEKYLNEEKDLKILIERLEFLLGIKDADVNKAIDRFTELEGKLPADEYVLSFFGTERRDFRDGLNYQVQKYMSEEGVKKSFLILYLLVLGNNDEVTLKNKQIPIDVYVARAVPSDAKEIFSTRSDYFKELELEKGIKGEIREDLAVKVMEGRSRMLEIESKGMVK